MTEPDSPTRVGPMLGRPVRVGIVGAGNAGARHAQAIVSDPSSVLVAIADADIAAAAHLAHTTEPGADVVPIDAIAAVSCDLWCVCTPPATHIDIARDLLASGAVLLIEKPLAASLPVATDFAADAKNRVFVVSQHRFAPASRRLKEIVENGTYGRCPNLSVRLYRHRAAAVLAGGWKTDPAQAGGGVLVTLAHHTLDIARWCFGAPVDLAALIDRPRPDRGETHVAAIGRLGSTAFALSATVGQNATVADAIVMEFEHARIEWRGDTLAIDGVVVEPRPDDCLHARQIHALTAAIVAGTPTGITVADSLETLRFVDRLYAAAGIRMGGE